MKNRNFIKNSMLLLLPISLGLGVLLGVNKKEAEQVEGYSTSTLPTTIDLNDTSAANIRSYYSSLNNLGEAQRKGTNLLKNLKNILKNGQKYYSYDSTSAVWQMYEIADRDWVKSPASSTKYGTYNASTNKITNYSYGTSASNSKNNPYLHALYINRDVENLTTAWDDHQQTQWGINREHVWPKAEGFEETGAGGARGDPMHLMAGNGKVNNIHSNYYYGYVDFSQTYTNCGKTYSNHSGNYLGKSKTLGGTTNVFEPQDSDKGDIARAIFYMVARYNYLSESDSDGIDSNNPNLALTQSLSDWENKGYSSTTSKTGKMGVMTDLLAWHHLDPVDEFEIHRNNLLYTNFTNNRNPFIDFPEWADFIWGSVTYNGREYGSYSSTPTGAAKPSTDTINGYNSGGSSETVSVTGVSLDKTEITLSVGEEEVLTPTVLPSNATDKGVSWSSSNTNVATVSASGRITAITEGNATITVTTDDGNKTATCAVTVTAAVTPASSGDFVFNLGSDGDHTHSDGTSATEYSETVENVTLKITDGVKFFSGARDAQGNGCFKVGITNTNGSFNITIPDNLEKVKIYAANYKNNSGAEISIGGGTGQTISGKSDSGEYDEFVYEITNESSLGVSFTGRAMINKIVFVFPKTPTSISVDDSEIKTQFYIGDAFNHDNLTATVSFDDGSEEILDSGFTVSSPDMSTVGEKTITVSYEENSTLVDTSYLITVSDYGGKSNNYQRVVSKSDSSYFVSDSIYLSGNTSSGSASCDAFSLVQSKESSSSSVSYGDNRIIIYPNHSVTITPKEEYAINSIILVADSAPNATKIGNSSITNATKYTTNNVVRLVPNNRRSFVKFKNQSESDVRYIVVNFEHLELSWVSPTINVFSGEILTGNDVNEWGVTDGENTYTYSQLTIKLGGTQISIPHTWTANDDGKVLTATYDGISTPESPAVIVTQSINAIDFELTDSNTFEFTNKYWAYSGGVGEWTGTKGAGYANEGVQVTETISPIDVVGKTSYSNIDQITVKYHTNKSSGQANLTMTVGDNQSTTNVISHSSGDGRTEDYSTTFTYAAKQSGIVSFRVETTTNSVYIRSIIIHTNQGVVNIANNAEHKAAQKVAVKFANSFNSAMSATDGCTKNLDSAWSSCASYYETFKTEAEALGATEEQWAQKLIVNAVKQYTDDSREACIERMMKTYEVCVQKHGKTAFMSDLITLGSAPSLPGIIISKPNNTVVFLIVLATISVGAIGVFFFTQSRKKEEI